MGKRYALNAAAESTGRYRSLSGIWAVNGGGDPVKTLDYLTNAGLDLCRSEKAPQNLQ